MACGTSPFGKYSNKPKGEFYATPEIAIQKLLEVEKFGRKILEPCCGDGAISRVLEEQGYDVTSRDLHDWGFGETGVDFLEAGYDSGTYDGIVTNPPFSLFAEFAEKSYVFSRKSALLGRLQILEGQKREALFSQCPLSRVWVFRKRLPRMHQFGYNGKKCSSMVAFAWFVWDEQHDGEPTLGWL
jgi:hypothetical protein